MITVVTETGTVEVMATTAISAIKSSSKGTITAMIAIMTGAGSLRKKDINYQS